MIPDRGRMEVVPVSAPAYYQKHVEAWGKFPETCKEQGLPESVMVDCSHGNSLKDFRNQPMVAKDLAHQISGGSKVITSVMIESNLVEGNQKLGDPKDLTHGQSVTDACLGWDDTVEVLDHLAGAVRTRRDS